MEDTYRIVYDLASRGAVDQLVYLYGSSLSSKSSWTFDERIVLRALINSVVPSLIEQYKLDLDEDTTFLEFIREYTYYRDCPYTPNICLRNFAIKGDLLKIETAISKGANDWNLGLYGAAYNGSMELIDFFIEKGADDLNKGLHGAARERSSAAKSPDQREAVILI